MNNKIIKIKNGAVKIFKISKNILLNAFKELFNNSKLDKIKKFIDKNKFSIITSTIVTAFICKNIYTIYSYNKEIEKVNEEIKKQTAINNQLKEDLEYYKTDEFILRYAIEELNLRPTKKSKLFHGDILPSEEGSNLDNIENVKPDSNPKDSHETGETSESEINE